MSLTPRIYSSTDPGAPQLTGQAGALLSLLRAILVNGYGTSPNNKPGLGWVEEFTGTNKAVFRLSAVTGSGYRLRVDDANALYGLMRGFSSMTDIDTGADPTPTTAQLTNGVIWPKSKTADSTARGWWAIGNERCVYLFVEVQGTGIPVAVPYFAGDLLSLKPGDLNNFALSFANITAFTGVNNGTHSQLFMGIGSITVAPASTDALVIARVHSGAAGAVFAKNNSLSGNPHAANAGLGGGGGVAYPTPSSGGLLFDRAVISDGANSPRAFYPGAWFPLHDQPLADLAEVSNPDGFPGGSSLVVKSFQTGNHANNTSRGQVLFDKLGAWT